MPATDYTSTKSFILAKRIQVERAKFYPISAIYVFDEENNKTVFSMKQTRFRGKVKRKLGDSLDMVLSKLQFQTSVMLMRNRDQLFGGKLTIDLLFFFCYNLQRYCQVIQK